MKLRGERTEAINRMEAQWAGLQKIEKSHWEAQAQFLLSMIMSFIMQEGRAAMRSIAKTVGLCLSVGFMTCGLAQTPTQSQPGILELRLEPESVQKNIPKAFTVLIVNKSDHEVRLPCRLSSRGMCRMVLSGCA